MVPVVPAPPVVPPVVVPAPVPVPVPVPVPLVPLVVPLVPLVEPVVPVPCSSLRPPPDMSVVEPVPVVVPVPVPPVAPVPPVTPVAPVMPVPPVPPVVPVAPVVPAVFCAAMVRLMAWAQSASCFSVTDFCSAQQGRRGGGEAGGAGGGGRREGYVEQWRAGECQVTAKHVMTCEPPDDMGANKQGKWGSTGSAWLCAITQRGPTGRRPSHQLGVHCLVAQKLPPHTAR